MTRESQKIHLEYAKKREVVFFFGAGASAADGIPLQRCILPKALAQRGIRDSPVGRVVLRFLERFFGLNSKPYQIPSLETVFDFLDYFISRNEHLDSEHSVSRLREIQECLVKIIHYVIGQRETTNASTHRVFWEAVGSRNRNVSIVSLNYDSVLDEEFDFLYAKHAYIDYCINLLNYDFEGDMGFNWWINPRKPVTHWGGNPVPIKLLKLHGSLNWKFCRACRRVLLTPWSTEIDLEQGAFFSDFGEDDDLQAEYLCPVDGCRFKTLILPPAYVKDLRNPIVSTIGTEIEQELRITKKIVFVGYSLPDADVHIRAIFAKSLSRDTHVFVVNPDNHDEFQSRYRYLAENVSFIDQSFESFVRSDTLRDILEATDA